MDDAESLRFAFGKNWQKFLSRINEDRILEAEKSLQEKLDMNNLAGLVFVDIGCGSGLFSLAAYRLGAKVFSFDYDENAVNCAKCLRAIYVKQDDTKQDDTKQNAAVWQIEQGSILDRKFLQNIPKGDVVYSWGVLHHTGDMYQAFENVAEMVKDQGKLFISIYNNQGRASKMWKWVKKTYNRSELFVRAFLLFFTLLIQWVGTFLKDLLKSGNPLKSWLSYATNNRGMSASHDLVDWTGGYPFEVAKPEEVFSYFKNKKFQLEKLKTCAGGLGCNEFVFKYKD